MVAITSTMNFTYIIPIETNMRNFKKPFLVYVDLCIVTFIGFSTLLCNEYRLILIRKHCSK